MVEENSHLEGSEPSAKEETGRQKRSRRKLGSFEIGVETLLSLGRACQGKRNSHTDYLSNMSSLRHYSREVEKWGRKLSRRLRVELFQHEASS